MDTTPPAHPFNRKRFKEHATADDDPSLGAHPWARPENSASVVAVRTPRSASASRRSDRGGRVYRKVRRAGRPFPLVLGFPYRQPLLRLNVHRRRGSHSWGSAPRTSRGLDALSVPPPSQDSLDGEEAPGHQEADPDPEGGSHRGPNVREQPSSNSASAVQGQAGAHPPHGIAPPRRPPASPGVHACAPPFSPAVQPRRSWPLIRIANMSA